MVVTKIGAVVRRQYNSYRLKIMMAAKNVSVIARAGSGMLCRLNRVLLSLKVLEVIGFR